MSRRLYWWTIGIGLLVLAIILYSSVFVVSQTQQALVLRFGQVVAPLGQPLTPVTTPGLYYKLPLIDNVVYLEKRLVDLDSPPLEIIANDQKRLVVDAFGRYRIIDPLKFYQSLGSPQIAQSQLSAVLNSAVRRVLGDASFIDLVRDRRAALMARITEQVDNDAKGLGVDVVDVRIRSADLPAANSQAIYQRMQTERQLVAAQTRAQGDQAARTIRAEADRQATVIVAEANGESARLRGDGEGQRNQILAAAFSQDPDFFAFYRALQAYQTSFQSNDTRLILSPNSDFFRYFNNPVGTSTLPAPATAATNPAGATTPAAPAAAANPAGTPTPAAPAAATTPAAGR
jgi:membrane protease subunit HflC